MNHFPSFLVDILDMISYEVILILQCNICRSCYHRHSPYSFCVRTGLVTDDDISQRESKLREFLHKDTEFRVKDDSVVEVAQVKLLKWLWFMSCSFTQFIRGMLSVPDSRFSQSAVQSTFHTSIHKAK